MNNDDVIMIHGQGYPDVIVSSKIYIGKQYVNEKSNGNGQARINFQRAPFDVLKNDENGEEIIYDLFIRIIFGAPS